MFRSGNDLLLYQTLQPQVHVHGLPALEIASQSSLFPFVLRKKSTQHTAKYTSATIGRSVEKIYREKSCVPGCICLVVEWQLAVVQSGGSGALFS